VAVRRSSCGIPSRGLCPVGPHLRGPGGAPPPDERPGPGGGGLVAFGARRVPADAGIPEPPGSRVGAPGRRRRCPGWRGRRPCPPQTWLRRGSGGSDRTNPSVDRRPVTRQTGRMRSGTALGAASAS
jgi:hypothetical protein